MSKSNRQDHDLPVGVATGSMVHTPVIVFGVCGSEPAHMRLIMMGDLALTC